MKKIQFTYLSQKDILDVGLTMSQVIGIVHDVFIEHGNKNFENPPKPGIHPSEDSFIHAMPGFLPAQQAAGVKWVSGFPDNRKYDLPSIMGLIIINDPLTGKPLGVMEGGYITALRTAAVSGVSARFLARPGAKNVAIIGAGVQGRYHLLALKEVLPDLCNVSVYDVHTPTLHGFVSHFSKDCELKIKASEDIQGAIKNADIVVTATGNLEKPIYKAKWLKKGVLVLPVHMNGWQKDILSEMDLFFVDDWEQFRTYMKPKKVYEPFLEPDAELGKIVIKKNPGRRNASQRIINFNLGIALHDIAIGKKILEQSVKKGKGTQLTLMDQEYPMSIHT
ncbi:MAG: ornithine cyclodeaminase family protein [Deltaproteobacteria bacterium]|jgi:ornithine cyclodeaminase/alanine dehydrogenase-like protein (mu-crystallin family)|nr:ornithine cyclodeaminase family protein [Deltaproteobacteria bacterium]